MSASARRLENLLLALTLVLAGWFFGWTATSAGSPWSFELQKDDLYNRLADGFLAGQLSFKELPPPELATLADPYDPAQNAPYNRYHDVSYFRGRYYLYFGPPPALLLAGWKVLTGNYFPQNLAVAGFAWGTVLLGLLLVRQIRRDHFPQAPSWVVAALMQAVTFGSLWPVLLRRPLYYELAIAAAAFFAAGALVILYRILMTSRGQVAWGAAASLSLGLAMACRPNYLIGAAAVLGLMLWWARRGLKDWRRLIPPALAAVVPLSLVGLAVLAYNHARFGQWTEFGTHYELAGTNQLNSDLTALRSIPLNLYYYFLAPPQFSAFFPFIQVTAFPPFQPPPGYGGNENMYGLLVGLPLLLAIGWLGVAMRGGPGPMQHPGLRGFCRVALSLAGANLLFLLFLAGANLRYLVDFVPVLMLLAGIGVLIWETRPAGGTKWLGRIAWTAALGFTVVFNVLVSFQHNDLLRFHNPEGYGRLAHAFNHVSDWLGQTTPDKTGPLRVRLELPKDRTGALEPLVVTGLSFRADYLYISYTDAGHIQIGFDHNGYGGAMTKPPIAVDYAAAHVLEIEMGSLYPPEDHPYYDGLTDEEVIRRKRTLRVTLDGREIFSGKGAFYDSSPGDVAVGFNPVQDAFGRRFTGRILSVERVPAASAR